MSAPVISASSGILGFRRNEVFEFAPAATNDPVRWTVVGLPASMSIETFFQKACTGDATTDVITCTAHGYIDGHRVYFPSLTGGAGLTTVPIYHVRESTTNTFKLASNPGGDAINFTTAITAAQVRRVSSGLVTGSGPVRSNYAFTLSATNTAGLTGTREFFMGIGPSVAPESAGTLDAIICRIQLPTCRIITQDDDVAFALKSGDIRMIIVRFEDLDGNRVDPNPTALKLVLKEIEPETVIVATASFEKAGVGATAEFFVPLDLTAPRISVVLPSYEQDQGTSFAALAEFEWLRDTTYNAVSLTLRASSDTFPVILARELAPNS